MNSLHGRRILNTRAGHQASSLSYAIEQRGGISIEIPLISMQSPNNKLERVEKLDDLLHSDWIIFTSVNSVYFTYEVLVEEGFYPEKVIGTKKLAAVGEKTKELIEQKGFIVDLCPDKHFDAEHLAKLLIESTTIEDIFFYPRSSQSRKVIVEALTKTGRVIHEMVVYETVYCDKYADKLNQLLKKKQVDIVICTSPSTVNSFFEQLEKNLLPYVRSELMFAVIGRVTADALSRYDVEKVLVPEKFTIDEVLFMLEGL
ncbi:uroporphyrinogen-III synthase [Salipaludibacillus sp. HK11]|uniref:uroporphyrinogen-III synthase n=1 Tax=Salipaludibacillus sp. HK11 TaxID=3394320 RepID=UPI0039FDC012